HLYEIIGALEGAALLSSGDALASREIETLERLNRAMSAALDAADFDAYYALNLDFHGVFLSRSDNEELKRTVRVCRQRLYDFPRERAFVPEWERRSIEEHAALIALIQEQDLRAAADFLRDVHWSFAIQMPFLLRYYHLDEPGGALE
ncbi:MAG: FCD domain-containing protein, partial [marine benthic group bacterium]|nr:FCD domain-containing protein [Gemmatimonadota bacterium]